MTHRIETEFHGRPLILETGRMARQADGAVYVQYGETAVLVTATADRKPTHLPFFPLTVEYREKTYAAGKFPGGFIKRETRPGEKETISARQIDRPLRPLFPADYRNDTQVVCFIISADQENDADVVGMLGASTALLLSPIPWNGPIAGVRVARREGEWLVNPTFDDLELCDMEIVVAGSEDSIVMVEGACLEATEDEFLEAMQVGQKAIADLIGLQRELVRQAGAPETFEYEPVGPDAEVVETVTALAAGKVGEALRIADKEERGRALSALREDLAVRLEPDHPDCSRDVGAALRKLEKETMRRRILEDGERIDGRGMNDVRDIACEVGLLPRTHGSALFTRGQTQALAVTTLGTVRDEQRIDSVDVREETSKSFMLHYNFPGFSTGEVRMFRGTSRRETGHGMLAERALQALLPAYEDFPYTIRVVSDILESNGSSSMASVCGGSLSLMDAGVPMRAPCAGIAMGLIKEGDQVEILTDILGVEDALGDMDFKVAGTERGITAVQMDIKADGLSVDTLREALARARDARLRILAAMNETLEAAREEMSPHAPRIVTLQINPQKIGEVIGPKGKTIRMIQEETGTEVNIDDSGTVTIAAPSGAGAQHAREMVEGIVQEPEVGRIYRGVVKNTTDFGAFVEIIPGVEGLCHISELEEGRTARTEDVVSPGDEVKVKLLAVDDRGRLKLSRRAALVPAEEA
ncbi:MAG: polyribonucleotide nucleotidyltransferase [Gemmatimonadales bacterium]|nr:polyribonucleotide nucleotidyltransferase [Gemmatimonadales bacterium]MYG50707.1 polyribonucleotide nucleotidyltransferase [Gemmatimonadales bacterium]MYK02687.1 polyribonucleotide nucleotidyltransferase [Candidatus Palauibacter ramosifaciens]